MVSLGNAVRLCFKIYVHKNTYIDTYTYMYIYYIVALYILHKKSILI
jgi:hypothetical protein